LLLKQRLARHKIALSDIKCSPRANPVADKPSKATDLSSHIPHLFEILAENEPPVGNVPLSVETCLTAIAR
jgi:hypothetical protein